MTKTSESETALAIAQRLHAMPGAEAVVFPYRLARMVARVLVSRRLKERRKWCSLARTLARDPMVEDRLVVQAMNWLDQRGRGVNDASSQP